MRLSDLAAQSGCSLERNGNPEISAAATIEAAGPGCLVLASNAAFQDRAERSAAAAVLLPRTAPPARLPAIRSDNVLVSWALALETLYPRPAPRPGVHPSSVVDATAHVDPTASVGPFCVIGAGAQIGERCMLGPGVTVADHAEIGDDSILHARVYIGERCRLGRRNLVYMGAVIGADGFGLAPDRSGYRRIPQIGTVRTGDDVEIGANAAVDRAALGETLLEDGVKIDNLVQIGHNVTVGAHTVIAGQTGIAGSVSIGSWVRIGGQAGIADHVRVEDRAELGAQCGVIGNVAKGEVVVGYPARPKREFLRSIAALRHLPALLRRAESFLHSAESGPSSLARQLEDRSARDRPVE